LITVGAALVSVAICVGLASFTGGWVTPVRVIGVVLGVLGLGMVAGSFAQGRRAGRGLVWPAFALAVVGVLLTAVHIHENPFRGGLANQSYSPPSIAADLR